MEQSKIKVKIVQVCQFYTNLKSLIHVNVLVIVAQIDSSANETRQNGVQSDIMAIAVNVKAANYVKNCLFLFLLFIIKKNFIFCVRNRDVNLLLFSG